MEQNKNVPVIRFNGFEDEWNEIPFGNIAQVRRGLTYSPKDIRKNGVKVLRSSNINEDRFCEYDNDVYVDGNAINIDFVKNNDILITAANGSSRLVGKHALINTSHDKVVHGGFMLLASSKNPFFLNASMSSEWYRKFISKNIAGGNGAIGNLNKNHLESEVILIPKEPEQTQIGNFFKTLDSQINAQEQKHQKLINLKKAMLEKMFPKEGSDLPEIRFKGFTEKWEEKKLGNIVKIFNGYAFQSKNFVLFNSNIIVLTPGNVKVCGGYQAEKGHYYNPNSQYLSKFKFEVNDIFITLTDLTPTGQTLGYPAIIPNDGNIYLHNQRLGKLFDIKTDRLFLYHFLCTNLYHTNVVSTSSGTTVKHSSSEKIQLIKIFVPSLKEQQKIGEYFEKLDNLIQQSQEQIKKYKNIKQALLQKMFV